LDRNEAVALCAARFTDRSVRKIRAHGESPFTVPTAMFSARCVADCRADWYLSMKTISEARQEFFCTYRKKAAASA